MKLFNTMSRRIEDVQVRTNNRVTIYTCGLTVYSQPHIGNWVSYIYWDILVRALKVSGIQVLRVQNITDVGHLTSDEDAGEDKMLKSALKEGTSAWDIAEKYLRIAHDEAYNQLGLLQPDYMPRATDYIPQQIALVNELEKKGYTYILSDGVYFDTSKLKDYGKLARLDIEGLQFGSRVADSGKKNPTDFALWKFSPSHEKRDMEWDSPWGKGFPGWHLECSVMAHELLGDTVDIHTGGIDHIPVHHTNEIAQSETVTGKPLAHIWVHANHIKVDGTKMSKSLGNIYTLEDIKNKGYSLDAFKLMILSKHYSTEGNFTWEILESAQNRLRSFEAFADLQHQTNDRAENINAAYFKDQTSKIVAALNDNLNTPLVLQIIHETIERVETSHGIHPDQKNEFVSFLDSIDEALGLHLAKRNDISNEAKQLISLREKARLDQNFEVSDKVRSQLLELGITVQDTPTGSVWTRVDKF